MERQETRDIASLVERFRAHAVERGVPASRVDATCARLLTEAGGVGDCELADREAFLVALDRVAESDADLRAVARDCADDLWPDESQSTQGETVASRAVPKDFWIMLATAVAAAVAIKVPTLFGVDADLDTSFYLRNASFFALPFLALFLGMTRGVTRRIAAVTAVVFVVAAVVMNVYPFAPDGQTEILAAIHLPIVLWLTVGLVFASEAWRDVSVRMEFVRFTGEWFVTFVLIALGGGVLSALTVGTFEAIGVSVTDFVGDWLVPCGAMGAVVVAAWLVTSRRNLVGGMAPMLARVFTPLFAVMLVALLAGVVWTRGALDIERQVLIMFDLLLVVVLALVLYAMSARDPRRPAALFDRLQLLLVACALGVDLFALATIAMRLGAYGFTANKLAALGLNLILLVNLAWSAYLQFDFVWARRSFADVERWQMRYIPVYWAWAAIVVVAFPPLFAFA